MRNMRALAKRLTPEQVRAVQLANLTGQGINLQIEISDDEQRRSAERIAAAEAKRERRATRKRRANDG